MKQLAATLKGIGWTDALWRRNPLYYRRFRALHAWMEGQPLEARRAWSQDRLARVLRVAGRTAYGRDVGSGRTLDDWPVLEKSRVREAPHRFTTFRRWAAAPANTSGTTGTPLRLLRSLASLTLEQAAFDHLIHSLRGLELRGAVVATLRGDEIKAPDDREPPFWKVLHGGRRLVMSSNHLSAATAAAYRAELAARGVDVLFAYPSSLEALAGFLADRGERVHIPAVLTHAEVQTPRVREVCRAAFGSDPIDQYGHAERVVFAYSADGRDYFFLPSHSHVELARIGLDPATGLDAYEAFGTTLWNEAMPLVRYRIGDRMLLEPGLTEAQRDEVRFGVRPFRGVLGRASEYLLAPDGRRLTGINQIPWGVPGVIQMQCIQDAADEVTFLVVPAEGFDEAAVARIRENAYAKLPHSMSVRVRTVERLERTAQGKTPFVIRRTGSEAP